jgi:hypothetical protein
LSPSSAQPKSLAGIEEALPARSLFKTSQLQ